MSVRRSDMKNESVNKGRGKEEERRKWVARKKGKGKKIGVRERRRDTRRREKRRRETRRREERRKKKDERRKKRKKKLLNGSKKAESTFLLARTPFSARMLSSRISVCW